MNPYRVAIFFMSRRRPGFDQDWGNEIEKAVQTSFTTSRFKAIYPEKIYDAVSLNRAIEDSLQQGAKGAVVIQGTMGDGRLIASLAQKWPSPLVLWATGEKPEGKMISSCSLVGTHVFAATLSQLGYPFVFLYTNPFDQEQTLLELEQALSLSRASHVLKKGKIGLIGHHAPGFIDMDANLPALQEQLGLQLRHISLHEFDAIRTEVSQDHVQGDLKYWQKLNLKEAESVPEEVYLHQSRYYLALKHVMETEGLDALSLREWPELTQIDQAWPYLAFSRFVDEDQALSCEGDLDGAVCHLIAKSLNLGSVFISDWLEHSDSEITLWHGGFIPFDWGKPQGVAGELTINKHFNSKTWAVLDGELEAGQDLTLFRLWCFKGVYHMTALEGKTQELDRELYGNHGKVKIEDLSLNSWFERKLYKGMPHHVSVVRGHQKSLLERFALIMNINWEA